MQKKEPTSIAWDDLESAVERNSAKIESFLDCRDGQVVTITQGDPEAQALTSKVREEIASFVRIEPASSKEQYRWMELFVASVADSDLHKRLAISIDGKGAFRRFKDELLAFPIERERWFAYRAQRLHWHITQWLSDNDIRSAEVPPWGEVSEPKSLPEVEHPSVSHGLAPGEALRHQAKKLVDTCAAIDLPNAIAFLEFLQQRSREHVSQAQAREGADSVEKYKMSKI